LPANPRQPQSQDDTCAEHQGARKKPVARRLARKRFVLLFQDTDLDFGIRQLLPQILVLTIDRERIGRCHSYLVEFRLQCLLVSLQRGDQCRRLVVLSLDGIELRRQRAAAGVGIGKLTGEALELFPGGRFIHQVTGKNPALGPSGRSDPCIACLGVEFEHFDLRSACQHARDGIFRGRPCAQQDLELVADPGRFGPDSNGGKEA
jgi:hypothetical protein